eukprot:763166-Hanusia_phi.AAC.2
MAYDRVRHACEDCLHTSSKIILQRILDVQEVQEEQSKHARRRKEEEETVLVLNLIPTRPCQRLAEAGCEYREPRYRRTSYLPLASPLLSSPLLASPLLSSSLLSSALVFYPSARLLSPSPFPLPYTAHH